MDCRSTPRASCWRSAPRYWAIWIENAVYSPTRMPWSSQVLELTMPMAAVASAPMWPHHGGVDVLHRRDHQLLQNGRDAQRQRDAGRVGQRDVLALPHPGRELLQRKCHVVSCFLC